MKIAIPTADGLLCAHFGHCQQFTLIEVDPEAGEITNTEAKVPPPHEPGVFPSWLAQQGCTVIIAGGMGGRAIDMFQRAGVQVVLGAPSLAPDRVVSAYLKDELVTGANRCDDSGHHGGQGGCGM